MSKRAHKYRLSLEYLENNQGEKIEADAISLDFDNHDDIFSIIETLKKRDFFGNEDQSVEFAIGLKLFSEVMLKNKDHELFRDFLPQFGAFMKQMKNSVANP